MKKKELMKTIKTQQEQINKLQTLVNELTDKLLLQPTPNPQTIRIIGPHDDVCIDGGPHDYPNPWFSVTPAYCKKCGKQARDMRPTYTCISITTDTAFKSELDSVTDNTGIIGTDGITCNIANALN